MPFKPHRRYSILANLGALRALWKETDYNCSLVERMQQVQEAIDQGAMREVAASSIFAIAKYVLRGEWQYN
jgi:hypothetical protein